MTSKLEFYAGKQPLPVEKKMWKLRKQVNAYMDSVKLDQLPDDDGIAANTMMDIVKNSFNSLELSFNALMDLTEKEVANG